MSTDATAAPDALYNRYRPRRLSELVGQDHVAVPLRRAFDKGRIHHAYLLSGPRGCGKTSTARILAAGLVCDNGPTADPCNTCDNCVQVIAGHHIDVIEMDAASNGGVDDARDLREKAHFSPAVARYKVIVVDEAHMVTTAAFNALLKLIEEPPAHVRFIFATTDPDKVLGTIRSRTYHYGFRLVPAPALAAHIEQIVTKEGATLDEGVLSLVLRAGGGSMRDSLAVLGQLLDGSDNGTVRLDEAAGLLGATADWVIDSALEAIAGRDTAILLGVIGDALDSGSDPTTLATDLLDRLRDLLLLATTGILPPLAEIAAPERQAAWRTVVDRLGVRGLTVACEVLQAALAARSPQPRIALEVAAARILLALSESVDVHGALTALSQQVANLSLAAPAPAAPAPAVPSPAPDTPQPQPAAAPADSSLASFGTVVSDTPNPIPPATPAPAPAAPAPDTPAPVAPAPAPTGPVGGGEADWERLLEAVSGRKRVTWLALKQFKFVGLGQGRIVLAVPHAGAGDGFRRSGNEAILTEAATETLGGTWTVDYQVAA